MSLFDSVSLDKIQRIPTVPEGGKVLPDLTFCHRKGSLTNLVSGGSLGTSIERGLAHRELLQGAKPDLSELVEQALALCSPLQWGGGYRILNAETQQAG